MIVIKIGGGAAIGEAAYRNFAADLAGMQSPVLVIHGGNAEFSKLSTDLGIPPRMVTNDKGRVSRYTDAATMDAMLMSYCGKVNKRIVSVFQAAGINAVGLSAMDGATATGKRKPVLRGVENGTPKVLRDDHAGTIEKIDARLVRTLMIAGYLPVVTPPALGEDGVPINVDGDKLALELAIALSAEALFFFSDTPGLLADKDDESTLIRVLNATEPAAALAAAKGRMSVKVEAALGAIERGVGQVIFSDARAEHPLKRAVAGEGTVVKRA